MYQGDSILRSFFPTRIIQTYISDILADSGQLMRTFGLVLFIKYPVFYYFWTYSISSSYENLPLRLAASALCIPLIFNSYWPKRYLKSLVVYWYIAACFCLPFFYTFMLFKNQMSTLWLMNAVAAIFYVMIVFDVLMSILIFTVGVSAAIYIYWLTTDPNMLGNFSGINTSGILITISCAYIVGNILSRSKQNISAAKQRSLKIAETHSQAKSDFIANASHDIRTPITGILGMAQDMLDKANDIRSSLSAGQSIATDTLLNDMLNTVTENSDCLLTATEELLHACNEILDISQLEHGKSAEQAKAFNIDEIIQHHIKLLAPVSQHKKVKLISNIDASVPRILIGIPIYLERILLNLLSNALKFTDTGYVKIGVTLANKDKHNLTKGDEIRLNLIIEDTGVGIPKDKFETIFNHFSRLKLSENKMYKSHGLGLYTVKHYVDAMNGHIHLESAVDKGSRFTLTIPFIHCDQTTKSSDTEVYSPTLRSNLETPIDNQTIDVNSMPAETSVASILIVEDSPTVQMAMKAQFKPYAVTLDFAETGFDAVEKVHQNKYDLIFMDIDLPDISGIEATKQIRALSINNSVPIIALTGHAYDMKKRQATFDIGIQDVHNKPINKTTLNTLLRKYIPNIARNSSDNPQTTVYINCKSTIIDKAASIQMCNGDSDFTQEILHMLADDLKNTKSILAKAYADKDIEMLRMELHRARGGVCYVKVPQLEQALKDLHLITKTEILLEAEFEKAYLDVQQAIENFWEVWQEGLA